MAQAGGRARIGTLANGDFETERIHRTVRSHGVRLTVARTTDKQAADEVLATAEGVPAVVEM